MVAGGRRFYEEQQQLIMQAGQESILPENGDFLAAKWSNNNMASNCEMDNENIPFSCHIYGV